MYLGIDFGTCYSIAAILIDGRPTLIPVPLSQGYTLPSSIFITEKVKHIFYWRKSKNS
jgi:molecular chaperone DnaK